MHPHERRCAHCGDIGLRSEMVLKQPEDWYHRTCIVDALQSVEHELALADTTTRVQKKHLELNEQAIGRHEQQLQQLQDENQQLRKFAWLAHGCGITSLYGDDGEMQCSDCKLDFKRDPIDTIFAKLDAKNIARIREEFSKQKWSNHEKFPGTAEDQCGSASAAGPGR